MQWSEQKEDPTTNVIVTTTEMAVFGNDGIKETNKLCKRMITSFATRAGRAEQYEKVQPIIYRLWDALIVNLGYPIFREAANGV